MSQEFNNRLEKERINFYLNFIAKEMRNGKLSSYDKEDLEQIKNYYSLFSKIEKNELVYQLLNTDSDNMINWSKFLIQEKWDNILEVSPNFYAQKISKQFEQEDSFSIIDVLLDNPKINEKAINTIFNHLIWNEDLINYTLSINLAYRTDNIIHHVFQYMNKKEYIAQLNPQTLKDFFLAYIDNKKYPMDLCMDLFFNTHLNVHPFQKMHDDAKNLIIEDKNFTLTLLIKSIRLSNKKVLINDSFFVSLKDKITEKQLKDAFFHLDNNGDFFSHTYNQIIKNKSYVDIKLLGNILSYFNYYNKIAKQLNFTEIELDIKKPINQIEDNDEKLLLLEKLKLNATISGNTKIINKKLKI